MASGTNPINAAFDRISLLKMIVAAERSRAEGSPYGQVNRDRGIVDPDEPKGRVTKQIERTFNDLELFLDHLLILSMAASFEHAAKARITTAVGEARSAVEKGKRSGDRWPAKLVRGADSLEGLYDIGVLVGMQPQYQQFFGQIRDVRNEFSHGKPVKGVPVITADDARQTLLATLERLKGSEEG